MSWIAAILVSIGKRLFPAVICWYFTPERGEQHREADRVRWWAFHQRSVATLNKADDAIAVYLQARFNYHDSPDAKRLRATQADIDKWQGPVSDRGKP